MKKFILIVCVAASMLLVCCQRKQEETPVFGALISENAEAMRQKGELEQVGNLEY